MYVVLSLRDEDIKNAIKLFNETCVISFPFLLISLDEWSSLRVCWMTARILPRRISDEVNEHLPPVDGQLTFAPSSLPNTKSSPGEKAATANAGATTMTPFRRTKEGGESEAKRLNTEVQDSEAEAHSSEEEASEKEVVFLPEKAHLSSEHFEASISHAEASPKTPEEPLIIPETSYQRDKQSDTSRHQPEPRTNRATLEVQDIEKQLQEKERHLRIREAEVQGGEKVLRVKERHLQFREAEVQTMFRALNERREVMDLQEDNLRQRLATMKEWEENLRLKEAALTQQMTIARQPNDAARGSDLPSLSSISTIRNSPRMRGNVDLPSQSIASLYRDSRYHDDELVSLARGGPSDHTNIGFSSSKSHARWKEDSEYYSNE